MVGHDGADGALQRVGVAHERAEEVIGSTVVNANGDEVAEIVDRHPKRFSGLGTGPMQDTPAAIDELTRITRRLRNLQSRWADDPTVLNYSFTFGSPETDGLTLEPLFENTLMTANVVGDDIPGIGVYEAFGAYGWHPENYDQAFDPLFVPVLARAAVTYSRSRIRNTSERIMRASLGQAINPSASTTNSSALFMTTMNVSWTP